jgi:hypothetical protein
MVQIDFEMTKNGFTLKDALMLPDDHGLSVKQIQEMKQARVDNWYNALTLVADDTDLQE